MNTKILNVYTPKNRIITYKLREKLKSAIPADAIINIVKNSEFPTLCEVNFDMHPVQKLELSVELMEHCTNKKTFKEWVISLFN